MKLPRFQKSHLLFIQYILVGVIALSVGLYFRLYPLRAHTSENYSEKATLYVIAQIRQRVNKQVKKQYSKMPKQQQDILAEKLFDEILHKERTQVRQTIDQVTKNIQQGSQTTVETPYLLASDSFYHYDLTQNIIQFGNISDRFQGSKYLNKRMLAPTGHWEPITLHPFVGHTIYQTLKIFYPNISLMHALSFTPLVITSLSLAAFIIICFLLQCRPIMTLIGSVYFLLAPIFVKRSTYGWYDNDPYNILFPLMIMACLFWGLKRLRSSKNTVLMAGLSAMFILLYSLFWQGWVFMFSVVFGAGIAIVLYNSILLKNKGHSKKLLLYFCIIFGGSFFGISLAFGFDQFFILFEEGGRALKNFLTPQLSPWPDLYISVGELHKASFQFIVMMSGGYFFFYTAIIGCLISIIHLIVRSQQRNPFYTLFMLVLLASTILISFGAQRFTMLCVVPLGLFFTIGLQEFFNSFKSLSSKIFTQNDQLQSGINWAILSAMILLIALPIRSMNQSMRALLNPIYNDTWDKALTKIREHTPPDAIINTWWSPGHFIKATAKRRVTFDGATINVPQAYWMANVFLSQSEEEALGFLRMLNSSGNQAAEYLQKIGFRLSTTVKILKLITKFDETRARILLTTFIKNKEAIDQLLKLTHGKPAPSYCLIYNEFVESNLQLNFIGGWNFKKIEEINQNPDSLRQVPKRNSPEYVKFLWSLVGGPHKYSGPLAQVNQTQDTVTFENDVVINLKTMDANVASKEYGTGIPASIFYIQDDKVIEKKLANASLSYSIILYKNSQKYSAVLLDRPLAKSFLMQLYFFEGKNFKYIKPFAKESDLTNRTVIQIFEMDWDQYEKTSGDH